MTQYRSRHKAIVLRNNDPEKLGNVWVQCQTLAAYTTELPFPIKPAPLYLTDGAPNGTGFGGMFFVPEVGSEVEIEVFDGTSDDDTFGESALVAPDALYYPTIPTVGQDIPVEFKTNYPKRGGLKTAAGHVILFDNTDGQEMVQIIGNFGKAKQTKITLTKDKVLIDNPDAVLTLAVKNINLDLNADSHLVRGEDLLNAIKTGIKAIFDVHTHPFVGVPPGASGVTLPPPAPMTDIPTSALSANHKVK